MKEFHFNISLPDENRDVVVTIEAENENNAWDKLPREVEKHYEGRRWYYNNRFRIVDEKKKTNPDEKHRDAKNAK